MKSFYKRPFRVSLRAERSNLNPARILARFVPSNNTISRQATLRLLRKDRSQ
jgi:hypothetical protein